MGDIQAVVFDLYNTLIHIPNDSHPYPGLIGELDLPRDKRQRLQWLPMTQEYEDLAAYVEDVRPLAKVNLAKFQAQLEADIASAELFPDTIPVLERLKEKGIKLGLISNLATPYKKPFFNLGLDKYFDDYVNAFITDLDNPNYREFMKATTLHFNPDIRQPKKAATSEMKHFAGEKLVLACEKDILFPLKKMQKQINKIFNGNAAFEILEGQKHLPSLREEYAITISDRIECFLKS